MNVFIFCASILIGIYGWGFLLAGALIFDDPQNPAIRGFGRLLVVIDIFISFCVLTTLFVITRNWRRKPEARHLLYMGLSCLAASGGLVWLSFKL